MKPFSIKKIVVGTDFSEGSDAAMAQAFSLALTLHAVVDLVHVVEPGILITPASLGAMPLMDGPALFEEIDRALATRADEAKKADVGCQTHSLQGFPPSELVGHAKKTGADLIVVGTHGRTGFAHAILGSTAERVVQRALCPVLVIPVPRIGN
ncbi:MAG: universal stress protein UspA [Myxococcales bacterium]|nr:universal stress protein UspA [Myxococcales bacterium]